MNITKAVISRKISDDLNIKLADSNKLTCSFFEKIKNESSDKTVKLNGFGTFSYRMTKKRIGRNPKTKESYIIEPMFKLALTISTKIKEVLNWLNICFYFLSQYLPS